MRHPASRPSMRHSTCLILAIVAVSHIASSDGRKPFWGNAKPKDCRCGVVQRSTASGDYIMHGKETEVNEYPWQVRLEKIERGGRFMCGGSLIGDKWVLTAAHCLPKGRGTIEVYLASHSRRGLDGIRMVPKSITRHPKYAKARDGRELYDFALIELPDRINFYTHQNIRPICLPKPGDESYEGETAIATGWGLTETGDGSWNLKEVEVKVISNSKCRKDTSWLITEQMICAGDVNGKKDANVGDSGGPLIAKRNSESYELIGVTSFGSTSPPGVYARVSNQMGWITKITGGSLRSCPRQN